MNRETDFQHCPPHGQQHVFTLYVAGHTVRSLWTIALVQRQCEEYFSGNYELRVVDVFQYPQAAEGADVIATPTLIKHQPMPMIRTIGSAIDMEHFTTNPT
jgi:circadian clock protein KaiB